jgi:hypothetical protein
MHQKATSGSQIDSEHKKSQQEIKSLQKMCQVRRGGILPLIITKNNNILELQHFLKQNNYVGKSTNKFKIPIVEDLIKTNQ